MNIILTRITSTPHGVDGILSIDGQKVCDTAENPDNHLEAGTYPVTIHHCHHYRRKMPVVVDCLKPKVEGQSLDIRPSTIDCMKCKKHHVSSQHADLPTYCPMIKIGNGVHNRTDGSIIIGDHRMNGVIIHSSTYYDRLIDRLDKAANRGEQITLTIS